MTITSLLEEAMKRVADHPRAREPSFTAFMGVKGDAWRHELMVVGRSVNGWNEWVPSKIRNAPERAAWVAELAEEAVRRPLAWVSDPAEGDYSARRSAFWRTARKVLGGVTGDPGDDRTWASRLAWSNLYKVSETEGNPADWMYDLQEDICIRMLREEISAFQPERILFSTGLDWAEPFIAALQRQTAFRDPPFVEEAGRLRAGEAVVPFVVAPHPMTRPEAEWSEAVVGAFRRLDEQPR